MNEADQFCLCFAVSKSLSDSPFCGEGNHAGLYVPPSLLVTHFRGRGWL